jgi:hypothetical protein
MDSSAQIKAIRLMSVFKNYDLAIYHAYEFMEFYFLVEPSTEKRKYWMDVIDYLTEEKKNKKEVVEAHNQFIVEKMIDDLKTKSVKWMDTTTIYKFKDCYNATLNWVSSYLKEKEIPDSTNKEILWFNIWKDSVTKEYIVTFHSREDIADKVIEDELKDIHIKKFKIEL